MTTGSSMYKETDYEGAREDNKQKKILCIGAVITLIVAAIVLIVVLVPQSGSSDSGGGTDKPVGGKCPGAREYLNSLGECETCPEF